MMPQEDFNPPLQPGLSGASGTQASIPNYFVTNVQSTTTIPELPTKPSSIQLTDIIILQSGEDTYRSSLLEVSQVIGNQFNAPVVVNSLSYNISISDNIILSDAASGNQTFTLPSTSSYPSYFLNIPALRIYNNGAFNITVGSTVITPGKVGVFIPTVASGFLVELNTIG